MALGTFWETADRVSVGHATCAFAGPADVPVSPTSLELWRKLSACTGRIEAGIHRKFYRTHHVTLAQFQLMDQVEPHDAGLQMTELSRRLGISGGAVTWIAKRLNGSGFVDRIADQRDGRALRLKLTPAGRVMWARIGADYATWFGDLLVSATECEELWGALSQLDPKFTVRRPKCA
jgi:DNA-binding MarR family transcriptional regulator